VEASRGVDVDKQMTPTEISYRRAIVSAIVSVFVWGSILVQIEFLPLPYLIAPLILGILNLGHFFFIGNYADFDISDIPTRGVMTSYVSSARIEWRILVFLTIGPSAYVREALDQQRKEEG
jgi:hypothetical protein